MSPQPSMFGKPPLRTIRAITKKQFGEHGGSLLVVHLDCGHSVEHMNNSGWKVGKKTKCEACR